MTEVEAWRKVDQLWQSKGLGETDNIKLDMAGPFMEAYIKEVKNVDTVDEGLL